MKPERPMKRRTSFKDEFKRKSEECFSRCFSENSLISDQTSKLKSKHSKSRIQVDYNPDSLTKPKSSLILGDKWQRTINTWEQIKDKFRIPDSRYEEFEFLKYLDLNDPFIENYLFYNLGKCEPIIKGRIKCHYENWKLLNPPKWLLSTIENGVRVPFKTEPPIILLPNNKSACSPENVKWIRETLLEYLKFGFVKMVSYPPKVISPLQVSTHSSGKRSLIHDESYLNEFIHKQKFRLENWSEMLEYSIDANYSIQFDMKKFYYELCINEEYQTYFGFMFPMKSGEESTYFVWTVVPYGYTRAPYIAKSLIKPLISKWRELGILVVVFYDDGMAVSDDKEFMKKASLQIQCDLLRCGLLPGIEKCIWKPSQLIDWIGLRWNFNLHTFSIMPHRISKIKINIEKLIYDWPQATFREVARIVGQIISMSPVFEGRAQLRTIMLQGIVNVKHFHECSWDEVIFCDYGDRLLNMALEDLKFWL